MSTWEYQISEAIRENRNGQTMHFTIQKGHLRVIVRNSGCTLNLTKLPGNIGLHWIKYEPSADDESAGEAAKWIADEMRRMEAGT